MRLRELSGIDSDSEVTGFAIDHRKVAPGSVFGAFQGQVFDGEDFIGQAVTRGAVAVVARPEAQVSGAKHIADAEPRRGGKHRLRLARSTIIAARNRIGVNAIGPD